FIPALPRSTLFPYTTLFRSRDSRVSVELDPLGQPVDHHVGEAAHLAAEGLDLVAGLAGDVAEGAVAAIAVPAVLAVREIEVHELDRKSTRLNSSHDQISYAV